ncbi:MAG: PIN domain-containing protein [Candidatus Sigynarchaeota archaeon]
MRNIYIDTGVLSNYFSSARAASVKALMDEIRDGKSRGYILKPVLVEVFYHICSDAGLQAANAQVVNFIRNFPIVLVDIDEPLILHAGKLKCQHAAVLSYIDCMSIAYCLRENIEFHTTEKLLKAIPHNTLQRLRVIKHSWSDQ